MGFEAVEQEVDLVDAAGFPLLELLDDAFGAADADAFGRGAGVARALRGLLAGGGEQAGVGVGAGRVDFADGQELGGEVGEGLAEAAAGLDAGFVVGVAVEEVDGGDLLVDEFAGGFAGADAAAVFLDLALLLTEAAEGEAERAEPALGGVDLGARAGDGDPHRRVRLLVGLGQDGAGGH